MLSAGGLFVIEHPLDGGSMQAVADMPAIACTDVQQTADGTLWVSTANGLFRLQNGQWSKVKVKVNGGAPEPWISKFHISDSGEVWLAFYRPGLWHGMLLRGSLDLQEIRDDALRDVSVYLLRGGQRRPGLGGPCGRAWRSTTVSDGRIYRSRRG